MAQGRKVNLRAAALKMYVEKLSPNLIRAYVLDLLDDASDAEIEKFVVALHAQNAVPPKGRT